MAMLTSTCCGLLAARQVSAVIKKSLQTRIIAFGARGLAGLKQLDWVEALKAAEQADAAAEANASARIEALTQEGSRPSTVVTALRALFDAGVVDCRNMERAIEALAAAGVVQSKA